LDCTELLPHELLVVFYESEETLCRFEGKPNRKRKKKWVAIGMDRSKYIPSIAPSI
jgi:hypothetical protein